MAIRRDTTVRSLALSMLALLGYAAAVGTGLIPRPVAAQISDVLVVLPFAAVFACFRAARRHTGRTRRGWIWLGGAIGAAAVYNLLWIGLRVVLHVPVPEAVDVLFLALIPVGMIGILNLAVRRDRSSTIRRTFDAVLIGVSVFIVSWSVVLRTLYMASHGSPVERALDVVYPVGDIIILSLVVFVATRYRTKGTTPLTFIGLAMVVWALSDTAYAYLSFADSYSPGHPLDAAWMAGYVLVLVAALKAQPSEAHHEEPEGLPRVHLPYVIAAVSLTVGLGAQLLRRTLDPVIVYGLLGLCVLALARQFLAILEHQSVTIGRLRALDDTKSSILRAVSHELRTPLTFIKGTSMLLTDGWRDMPADTIDDLFSRVVANCDRLDHLLGSLLDLERLSRGIIEPTRQATNARELLERVADSVRTDDHSIRVTGDAAVANIDPGQVERIVENLLVNAVRHTPSGTRVNAHCEHVGAGLLITVEDSGPGIPAGMDETIFDPFVQDPRTSDAGRGTGVGLALVAKFAQLHGGRAWVETATGGGARFRVLLPDTVPTPPIVDGEGGQATNAAEVVTQAVDAVPALDVA